MLYLAWRQRFGKASPRTDLTNGRQEATKPFFKETPTPKAASRNLLWNFLNRTTDSSSTGLSPLLQQPEGSPTTSHQDPYQQATGNQSAGHSNPINRPHQPDQQATENQLTGHSNPTNKLPCFPHNSLPSEAPRCIRHRSALHQPSQRAAQAHAAHCLSRSGKMGTDRKHIIRPPALRCHAPHLHPDRKRSVPRPPGHAFTPYKDRRPTSRLTSHHKKKQSFT